MIFAAALLLLFWQLSPPREKEQGREARLWSHTCHYYYMTSISHSPDIEVIGRHHLHYFCICTLEGRGLPGVTTPGSWLPSLHHLDKHVIVSYLHLYQDSSVLIKRKSDCTHQTLVSVRLLVYRWKINDKSSIFGYNKYRKCIIAVRNWPWPERTCSFQNFFYLVKL